MKHYCNRLRLNRALATGLAVAAFAWGGNVLGQVLPQSTTQEIPGNESSTKRNVSKGDSDAAVINQGHLYAAPGGYLLLASNQGSMSPSQGSSVLAAANALELNLDGYALLNAKITKLQANALIDNADLVCAGGGSVLLTENGRNRALSGLVNHSGVVRAQRWREDGGRIILDGTEVPDPHVKMPAA